MVARRAVDGGAFTPVRDGEGRLIPSDDQDAYRAYLMTLLGVVVDGVLAATDR